MTGIHMMLMSGVTQVNVVGGSFESTRTSPTDSIVKYQLTSGGLEQYDDMAGYTTFNTWLLSGSASSYDVRATVVSGSVTSGTTGSWLNLGTTREWTRQNTLDIESSQQVVLTIELSLAGAATPIDSATVTLTATVTSGG